MRNDAFQLLRSVVANTAGNQPNRSRTITMNDRHESLFATATWLGTLVANISLNAVLASLVSISWLIYIWIKIVRNLRKRRDEEDTEI